MTVFVRRAAISAALALLTFAACSPTALPTAPAAASASPGPAAADPAALPPSCRSLLTSMQSCSDNLSRAGSPLAASARGRIIDMRNAINGAPPEERASFCDIQAGAFHQLAQTYRCQ
jgi:hypothetical protein